MGQLIFFLFRSRFFLDVVNFRQPSTYGRENEFCGGCFFALVIFGFLWLPFIALIPFLIFIDFLSGRETSIYDIKREYSFYFIVINILFLIFWTISFMFLFSNPTNDKYFFQFVLYLSSILFIFGNPIFFILLTVIKIFKDRLFRYIFISCLMIGISFFTYDFFIDQFSYSLIDRIENFTQKYNMNFIVFN